MELLPNTLYYLLPISMKYPDSLPDDVAVFTEPLAAACEIPEQIHVHPTDRVIVIGDGKLGILCAQVLALTGCNLTVLGRHPHKLDILKRDGGSRFRADPCASIPHRMLISSLKPPAIPVAMRIACEIVRPRGTIVLKSTYQGSTHVNLSMQVVDEITVVGSRCGPFAPALRLLEAQRVKVTPLINARYPLAEAATAFEHAAQPGILKVLLDVPGI